IPKQPVLLVALLFVVILHLLEGLPSFKSNFALASVRVLIASAFMFNHFQSGRRDGFNAAEKQLLKDLPVDLRTALSKFDLEPDIIPYACC
ncbi:hypothetical protein BJ138DRAFT_990376, partial [Hygrophoropsis aurantiaca]